MRVAPTRPGRLLGAAAAAVLAVGLSLTAAGSASGTFQAPAPSGKTVVGQTSPIHDPALIVEGKTWYVFSTGLLNRENGGTIQIWTSTDAGTTWAYTGTVWDEIPTWIDERIPGLGNLWAPEIYEHDGVYYLYYSASQFGTDNSITALATNTTLDPTDPDYAWVDQGEVISSPVSGLPDGKIFNAIDAGIVEDDDGTPYMAIGSFWYGIFLVELEWPSGKPVENWQESSVHLVDRFMPGNPVEAPYIYKHDGWYYLFVSFGYCCQGENSSYQIAVGRSQDVKGPYLDQDGNDMFGGGGTILVDSHGAIVGPGGQSVSKDYLAFHYYDASNEEIPYFPTLGLQKLGWEDGWPTVDLTVELPEITEQPADEVVKERQKARFTLTGTGTPAPVAVWETSTDGGTTWTVVEDQPRMRPDGSSTLVLRSDAEDDGTLVRATLSNPHGKVTSETVELTVIPRRR